MYLPLSDDATAGSPDPSARATLLANTLTTTASTNFQYLRFTKASLSNIESKSARSRTAARRSNCRFVAPLLGRQSEDGQRSAKRGIGRQTRIATDRTETRRVDGLVLGRQLTLVDRAMPGRGVFGLQQTGRKADARPTADAGENGHVLLAAVLIGHDVADDAGRGLELVEFLARLGVDSLQVAFERAVEHHAAGRCESTAPCGELLLFGPDDLAGLAVPGDEVAHVAVALGRIHRDRRTDVSLTGRVGDLVGLIVHADVVGRHIEQLRVRAVGRRLLVLGPQRRRADALRVVVFTAMLGRIGIDDQRTAIGLGGLVHVDLAGPVHDRIEFFRNQQFAGGAIERVTKTVTVEMRQYLAHFAADVLVGQDHFVDAVEVPFVVRRHLIDPLDLAGVEVTRPDRHRPAVVAGALHRVPGRGVARAVIDQVQLGIVGIPTPRRAAADLPLIAFPGLDRGVRSDRLAERSGLLGVDQRVGVRTFRIAPPCELAVLDIVGADPAANAEFT